MSAPQPVAVDARWQVHLGDCVAWLLSLPEASVDAIVCDPPYALSMMGKSWDSFGGHENAGFMYWFTGFVDGEGHFGIKRHTRGTHAPFFAISLRADDRAVLEAIRKEVGYGNISDKGDDGAKHPGLRYVVDCKEGCQHLVDLFDKYSLRAKKRIDYDIWRQAVIEWTDRPRGNRWHGPSDNARMASLKAQIEAVRQYMEPPWSGHPFQDWMRMWAKECLRVLKPGGHLIAFGGTRTVHRLTCGVEDAGFEIRDTICWQTHSGFPKSLDVSKAIDAVAGAERQVVGSRLGLPGYHLSADGGHGILRPGLGGRTEDQRLRAAQITAPATAEAARWEGFGTAIKPSIEPAILARKPLEGTVVENVLKYGTGALNIDGCRFAPGDPAWLGPQDNDDTRRPGNQFRGHIYGEGREGHCGGHPLGRFPANLYHCPKASRSERERGCDGLPVRTGAETVEREEGSAGLQSPRAGAGRTASEIRNHHISVKPVQLMRWLCRLVTPPGGLVVDPFTGSGSTGIAALLEGFRFAGAEMEPDYHAIASARIAHALAHPEEWDAKRKPRRPKAKAPELAAEVVQLSMFAGGRR